MDRLSFSVNCGSENVGGARALYLEYLPLIEFVGGQAYVAGTQGSA
jgi:hypothetical protein